MKKIISEFKEFALKGNMLDLAIGLMVGTAFTTVVKSIVDDLFMPIIGFITGGKDFTTLTLKLSEAEGTAEIKYWLFIQNIINFLIIAIFLFLIVKAINSLKRRIEKKEDTPEEAPAEKPADIVLLEEIRDSIKELSNK